MKILSAKMNYCGNAQLSANIIALFGNELHLAANVIPAEKKKFYLLLS